MVSCSYLSYGYYIMCKHIASCNIWGYSGLIASTTTPFYNHTIITILKEYTSTIETSITAISLRRIQIQKIFFSIYYAIRIHDQSSMFDNS